LGWNQILWLPVEEFHFGSSYAASCKFIKKRKGRFVQSVCNKSPDPLSGKYHPPVQPSPCDLWHVLLIQPIIRKAKYGTRLNMNNPSLKSAIPE